LISPKKAELLTKEKSLRRESGPIHEHLYQEKDKYFESRKHGHRDSKLESEIKECTFSPNTGKRKDQNRSF